MVLITDVIRSLIYILVVHREDVCIKLLAVKLQTGQLQAWKFLAGKLQIGKLQAGKLQVVKLQAGKLQT